MIQNSVNQILSAIGHYKDFKDKQSITAENKSKADNLYNLQTTSLQSKIDLNKAKLEGQNAITATEQEKLKGESLKNKGFELQNKGIKLQNKGIKSQNDLLNAKTRLQNMKNTAYEQNTLDKQQRAMDNVKNNFEAVLKQRQEFMENMQRMKGGDITAAKGYDKQINGAIDRILGGNK